MPSHEYLTRPISTGSLAYFQAMRDRKHDPKHEAAKRPDDARRTRDGGMRDHRSRVARRHAALATRHGEFAVHLCHDLTRGRTARDRAR
jgi:hypothetical protein